MKYQIKIERDAQKFLKKLPRPDETRVLKAIAKLPDEGDRKQMKGHPGFFRLRG
ncbi:MAG: type II toxin-antitoxin system RelE family toxin [Gemmiger sp.]